MRNLMLVICGVLLFFAWGAGGLVTSHFGGIAVANAQTTQLRNSVFGTAGSPAQSTNFSANGTMAQSTPIGVCVAPGVALHAGFWGIYWVPTGVDDTPAPYETRLYQNFPNPFNPSTTIEYSIAQPTRVEIVLFDVGGRKVKTLVDEVKSPGLHRVVWDGRNERGEQVASGIFFCRLRADAYSSVRKMILLK
jgi:hypothetical protein